MTQRTHAHHLGNLLKRTRAAGHRDERIAEFDHFRAALRHGFGDDQLVDRVVLKLCVDEKLRFDAGDAAACMQCALREHAHQTGFRAAVDERVAALADPCAKCAHRLFKSGGIAAACAEIYGYIHRLPPYRRKSDFRKRSDRAVSSRG